MIEAIRKAALGAVKSGAPTAIMFGKVMQINPLEVNVDQRFTLDADFLIVPESLIRYEVDVGQTRLVIRQGFQQGDRLILLRVQGGQQYLVIDKVAMT